MFCDVRQAVFDLRTFSSCNSRIYISPVIVLFGEFRANVPTKDKSGDTSNGGAG